MCDAVQVAEAQSIVQHIIDEDILIPVVAIVMGCSVGAIAIISAALTKVFVTRGREATKREMAAYVAEGSISPENAIAMLNAGTEVDDEA